MLQAAIDLLVAAFILLVCIGVGARVLAAARLKMQPIERIAFALGAGSLILSLAMLLVGSFAGANQSTLAAVLLISAALCFKGVVQALQDLRLLVVRSIGFTREIPSKPFSLSSICALGIAALLALHFLSALSPPASHPLGPNDLDSLGYHLTAPEQYLLEGKIFFLNSIYQANWPLAVQMLYLPALAFASAVAAKLVAFGLCLGLVLAVFLLGRKVLQTNEGGFASVAVLLSSQAVSVAFGSATVDLSSAFYSALALIALLEWRDSLEWRWLAAAGLFAGGVGASKITSLLFLPAFALAAAWIVYQHWKQSSAGAKKELVRGKMQEVGNNKFRQAIFQLAVFCLIASSVVAPWLARTWSYAGNPVWPFYHPLFDSIGFADNGASDWTSSFGSGVLGAVGLAKNVLNLLLSPFYLTFQARLFEGIVTPLFLALVPPAFALSIVFRFRRPKHLELLLGFALAGYVAWFFSLQTARYLLPVFPALCVAAAFALVSLQKEASAVRGWTRLLPAILIFSVLLASFGIAFAYKYNALPVALGFESRESYLLRAQYNYAAAKWVNENLPENAKLLMVNDEQGYYYKRKVQYTAFLFQTRRAHELSQQQFEEFVKKELGAQYLVLNTKVKFEQNHLHAKELEALVNGLAAKSTLVQEANGILIYNLS